MLGGEWLPHGVQPSGLGVKSDSQGAFQCSGVLLQLDLPNPLPTPWTSSAFSLPLQCYKSSKDHSPQLDVNLLGSSVIHKEKQVRKQEHKLKITPMNADVIVLGLQSRDQAEQWLRVREAPGCLFQAPSSLHRVEGQQPRVPGGFVETDNTLPHSLNPGLEV